MGDFSDIDNFISIITKAEETLGLKREHDHDIKRSLNSLITEYLNKSNDLKQIKKVSNTYFSYCVRINPNSKLNQDDSWADILVTLFENSIDNDETKSNVYFINTFITKLVDTKQRSTKDIFGDYIDLINNMRTSDEIINPDYFEGLNLSGIKISIVIDDDNYTIKYGSTNIYIDLDNKEEVEKLAKAFNVKIKH